MRFVYGIGPAASALFVALALAAPAAPEAARRVPRVDTPFQVDGVLDDAGWKAALVLELPYEIDPGENVPARARTEVLVVYDAAALRVAFRAHDPNPAAIRAHLTDRDGAFRDDFVGFFIDPFNDERRAFELFVNPLGVQMDGSRNDVGEGGDQSEDMSWDAIWFSAARLTPYGYEVEIAVPFSSLRFPRDAREQTWTFSPIRIYPRSVRHQFASTPIDRNRDCFLCQAPKITGLAGMDAGLNLELIPTLTARHEAERDPFPEADLEGNRLAGDLGLSARYGVTPNLSLNAALNPDFSQVEADVAQLAVNTRFALYYPEKRPFFMEGADFFTTPFKVVYTRTVLEPAWGIKMSGKEGAHALGAAVGRDDETYLLFPSNQESDDTTLRQPNTVGTLRYRADVGRSSTVGVLATDREGSDYHNRVVGADAYWRITPSDTIRLQALRSDTRYPEQVALDFAQPSGAFAGAAATLRYVRNTRNLALWGVVEDLGRDFRADGGFIPRVDTRRLEAGGERVFWGGEGARVNRAIAGASGTIVHDHDGARTDTDAGAHCLIWGPRQMFLFVRVARREERFEGVSYPKTTGELQFNIRPTGDLTMSLAGTAGDAIDYDHERPGRILRLVPGFTYDVGRRLHFQIDHTYERLEVDGGRLYAASLSQARVVYQFSVRTFARAIVQVEDIGREPDLYLDPVPRHQRHVLGQLLFSYKVNPQTLFYIGASETRSNEETSRVLLEDRAVFMKIGYAWLP